MPTAPAPTALAAWPPTAPASGEDKHFASPAKAADFRFDGKVAAVFDDMVGRSVPHYAEIQRMTAEVAATYAVAGTRLYDLGCSTGTTLLAADPLVDPNVEFIGVDCAPEMLDRAREKFASIKTRREIRLERADLTGELPIEEASVVMLVLTLQFVRPLQREKVVKRILAGLRPGGCLLLVEKLTFDNPKINRDFIDHYYGYKRRLGYSELEISQKREALENVLIPYRFEENRDLLLDAGFTAVEEYFRWYNFSASVAVK